MILMSARDQCKAAAEKAEIDKNKAIGGTLCSLETYKIGYEKVIARKDREYAVLQDQLDKLQPMYKDEITQVGGARAFYLFVTRSTKQLRRFLVLGFS